jgi:transcriptional regulator with XRE-family HTH domain
MNQFGQFSIDMTRMFCRFSMVQGPIVVGGAVPAGDGQPDVVLGNRRRLGAELRRLREQAGLSGRQLADRIGVSQSKVSRIESGAALPSLPQVAGWAAAVGASESAAGKVMALAEAAYAGMDPWDEAMRGRVGLQPEFQKVEDQSRAVLVYEPTLVPGLLQTAEYARRIFTMFDPAYAASDIPRVVAGRMDRQVALFDPAREFGFLMTEAALRWQPGPPWLMLAQLDRIASISTLGNVTVGVIPQSAQALTHVPHGFVLTEPTDLEADALVLVETVHASLTVSDAAQVALYRRHWALLEKTAAYGADARDLISGIADSIRALSSGDAP